MERFRGIHVVVTGGGVGIGEAIARRLAAEGAQLSLLARGLERLERVGRELGAHTASCDIRDRTQVDEAVAGAAAAHGPIGALVAVSGIGGPNEDGPEDRFDDLVQTNLAGTYYTVRAALRHLAPGPEARHVVVLSSILARIAVPGYTGYSASKAGLLGLVRSLAAELAQQNVQVNAICPGWVDTDMAWQGLDAARRGDRRQPRRRPTRGDARGAARSDEPARGHRGHGRLAALRRRARRDRAGNRPERRRLDGLSRSAAALSARKTRSLREVAAGLS